MITEERITAIKNLAPSEPGEFEQICDLALTAHENGHGELIDENKRLWGLVESLNRALAEQAAMAEAAYENVADLAQSVRALANIGKHARSKIVSVA